MPSSHLFAVNNEGKIFALPTSSSVWKELFHLGLDFKKISVVNHFVWAIGSDRQVYVYAYGFDIPIRIKEELYENERWYPIEGFSSKLLPTDRFRYSSQDGTVNRDIDKIRCPSMAWQWEGDWQLELTHDGHPLDHDGWTYALDFPATYTPQKQWKSCVRRRKWFRYRKYSALNSWCAIAPLHKDATEEPFVDISIGGTHVPGAPDGTLSVWAVTSNGRVVFRNGVSATSPEGLRWSIVKTPQGCEVNQVCVGCTGLVWCSLFNGRALVRSGVTRDNLMGDNWLEVKPPEVGSKVCSVAVGRNSVWCITNKNHVWWRKGVKGDQSGESEDAAIGVAWVEMFGNMSSVSVTASDQVFAVGSEDRALYFRHGVNSIDPTGKKWRQVQGTMQMSRTSSLNSMGSSKSSSPGAKHKSLGNLEETSHSAPANNAAKNKDAWKRSFQSPPISEEEVAVSAPVYEHYESRKNARSVSPLRSVGSVVACEAQPDSDVFSGESCLFQEDEVDNYGSTFTVENTVLWNVVAAGALLFDSNQIPNWFSDACSGTQPEESTTQWRMDIIERLKKRPKNLGLEDGYEKAIEMSSWVKSGEAKLSKTGKTYEDCLLELEWIEANESSGSGTLSVLSSDGVTIKMQFSLSEIMLVASCSEPSIPRLAIHTPRLTESHIKMQFNSESEYEDWLCHLTSACSQLNSLSGKPSNQSVWATTNQGEVFVFDPLHLSTNQLDETEKKYVREIELSTTDSPYTVPLYNGLGRGTIIEVSGYVCPDADYIRFDFQSYPTIRNRQKERNIALHINPRFNERLLVFNSMEKSVWQSEVRQTDMEFCPGSEFSLIIDAQNDGFHISINSKPPIVFRYRSEPTSVVSFFSSGRVKIFKIRYLSPSVIMCPSDMYWRQIGGHMKRIESVGGLTWGISYDYTPYVYTGAWGGPFLKGLESNSSGIHNLTDVQNVYVYENQRWNPISGFSSTGLPTDRHSWSDVTGKHKRTKEHMKLLSKHWTWISDWLIDFHTPGGVNSEGWQFAVDFPSSYHPKKNFTDYVRRRRWYRKSQLSTTGPWQEIGGNTKIADISIFESMIWAIALNGEVLLRKNVSPSYPNGSNWEHVPSETPMISICAGEASQVWSVDKNGKVYRRLGITCDKPEGEAWQKIDSDGLVFKQVAIGKAGAWAIDQFGKLYNRKEITSVFPEGTHWQQVVNLCTDVLHYDANIEFKSVSVGEYVWVISNNGFMFKRAEHSSQSNPENGWNIGIPANFQHIGGKAL